MQSSGGALTSTNTETADVYGAHHATFVDRSFSAFTHETCISLFPVLPIERIDFTGLATVLVRDSKRDFVRALTELHDPGPVADNRFETLSGIPELHVISRRTLSDIEETIRDGVLGPTGVLLLCPNGGVIGVPS